MTTVGDATASPPLEWRLPQHDLGRVVYAPWLPSGRLLVGKVPLLVVKVPDGTGRITCRGGTFGARTDVRE